MKCGRCHLEIKSTVAVTVAFGDPAGTRFINLCWTCFRDACGRMQAATLYEQAGQLPVPAG